MNRDGSEGRRDNYRSRRYDDDDEHDHKQDKEKATSSFSASNGKSDSQGSQKNRDTVKRTRSKSPDRRWDDPVKLFSEKHKQADSPPKHRAPPNRFNIEPGRQWDGIDRSNGFEVEYFKKLAQQAVKKDLDYKYTVADILLMSLRHPCVMEKSELVRLIEEPILKAYKRGRSIETESITSDSATNNSRKKPNSHSNNSSSSSLPQVPLSEAQRDRRTVFLQQLSVKCTDRDLLTFFTENGCPARNARIVIDKYTRKSKGVGYVEFYEENTVKAALKLTGKKLVGVPIIVELTETEKNRIAQEAAALNAANMPEPPTGSSSGTAQLSSSAKPAGVIDDLLRLYLGALHPSLTEADLRQLFEPFGQLESVELLKDERTGVSKGVAFVQFKRPGGARMALEALNGFELAGRAIRIGPVRGEKSSSSSSSSSSSKPSKFDEPEGVVVEEEEEENIILDAKKRAELMQKLLLSRK